MKSNGLTLFKKKMNTGVMVILSFLKKKKKAAACGYSIQRTMPYICFVVMPPFLIHTYKKCCVQDFLLFTRGAF